jgi:hypothetical protein
VKLQDLRFAWFATASVLLVVMLDGCAPESIYAGSEPEAVASITPKSKWRAYGDFHNAQYAVDGNVHTSAVTGPSYDNAKFTIDLGKRCLFNTIIIDQGPDDELGFCRRIAVQVSNDGVSFYQAYTVSGTRRITYCSIVTPTMARYIRLVALVPGDRPWSIAEIYLE